MALRHLLALSVAFMTTPAFASPLQVSEFNALTAEQQLQIADASYNAVSVSLAFAQAEERGLPASKQFASCLRDRDGRWALKALKDYLAALGGNPTSAGAAITQAMMWRCGVLTVNGVDRPAFRRHPGAIIHGNDRGVYEQQQAVHG